MADNDHMLQCFPLEEFLTSQEAARNGIPNQPDEAQLHEIDTYTRPGMYRIRQEVCRGKPYLISSGLRVPDVNCLVGGAMSRTSLMLLVERTRFEVVREKAAARLRAGMGRGYGMTDSQHQSGNATDGTCPGFGSVWELCNAVAASDIPFDQLIYEFAAWMHVSFTASPRRQTLTILADGKGYTLGLQQSR